MEQPLPAISLLLFSTQTRKIVVQRVQDIGSYTVVSAESVEPSPDDRTCIPDREAALPYLCQEHPSKDIALAVNFAEAVSELPLSPLVWLVGVSSVEKNVNEQLGIKGTRSGRDER